MKVKHINHFSIRTAIAAQTVDFYCNVLGLENGFRPPFKFPGAWLYAQGHPIVHILEISGADDLLKDYLGDRQTISGTGSVDHIALECTDYPAFHSKLSALGLDFHERCPPETKQRQIFLEDPNGITVELLFPDAK